MTNAQPVDNNTKLLPVGKMWVNDRMNEAGTSPKLTITLDRNLGLNLTLAAGSRLLAFENNKREGRRDADYRIAVALPTEIVEAEIARQKELRGKNAQTVEATPSE